MMLRNSACMIYSLYFHGIFRRMNEFCVVPVNWVLFSCCYYWLACFLRESNSFERNIYGNTACVLTLY